MVAPGRAAFPPGTAGSSVEAAATGFLRLGTWNDEPNDPEEYKYERLEDLVHVATGRTLIDTAQGGLQQTRAPLDLALNGPGFFEVQAAEIGRAHV